MRRVLQAAGATVLLVTSCGAKRKKVEPPAPIVGWHQSTGARAACWHPPAFGDLTTIDRRAARDHALSEMKAQWSGAREDGVAFEDKVVEDLETVLLAYPDKIEDVAVANLARCEAVMAGGDAAVWSAWLLHLPAELTKDVCFGGLVDTLGWYLEVNQGWQGGADICPGEPLRIFASANDFYRLSKSGPWINVAGDPAKPAHGERYPCTQEGCNEGTLVLRFRGRSGVQIVKPIGVGIVFDPPEPGTIEFMVNDDELGDNTFKIEGGLVHHTSVTYEPLKN